MTMSKFNTFVKLMKNDRSKVFSSAMRNFAMSRISHLIPDKAFLKLQYRANIGRKLNLKTPVTFNEKLQWLKLYNRQPLFTDMVDKYAVRAFVAAKIGEEYLVPLLGVWDSAEKIDFDSLPEQFVLKCNHDSGSVIICKDKSKLDRQEIIKKLTSKLNRNLYYWSREWPYKNIQRKVICEEFMQDKNFDVLNVYKIMNFNNGEQIIQVIQGDKTCDESIDYFDTNWKLLDMKQSFPNSKIPLQKPKNLDKMLELAKKLSEGFPFLRTDFYEIDGKIYFSEFTFFSDAGMCSFTPNDWDMKLGERIDIDSVRCSND